MTGFFFVQKYCRFAHQTDRKLVAPTLASCLRARRFRRLVRYAENEFMLASSPQPCIHARAASGARSEFLRVSVVARFRLPAIRAGFAVCNAHRASRRVRRGHFHVRCLYALGGKPGFAPCLRGGTTVAAGASCVFKQRDLSRCRAVFSKGFIALQKRFRNRPRPAVLISPPSVAAHSKSCRFCCPSCRE